MPAAFYESDREAFLATASTRGPWDPDHQHAGPPRWADRPRVLDDAYELALSSRGKRLAFATNRDGDTEIFSADGSHRRQLIDNAMSGGAPAWQPIPPRHHHHR